MTQTTDPAAGGPHDSPEGLRRRAARLEAMAETLRRGRAAGAGVDDAALKDIAFAAELCRALADSLEGEGTPGDEG